MKTRTHALRSAAIFVLMVLLASACSGGDSATTTAPDETATEPTLVIPTTAPIVEDTEPVATVDAGVFTADPTATEEPVNEYESIVLNVKDSVDPLQTIPVFSAPTGAQNDEIRLIDVNAIDGTTQEYPLYATTQFDNRLTLMVKEFDASGNYALVYMPVRPNGTTAWVQTAFFDENRHEYRVEISLSSNEVRVYQGSELLRTSQSVAGRPERPTPVLRSYIDEKIPGSKVGPAYGDWVLSIAAFSEALGSFGANGGMPKLALHGTNQPELMGQYVSSGCVRIPNEVVSFIADTVPVGTPVDIIA